MPARLGEHRAMNTFTSPRMALATAALTALLTLSGCATATEPAPAPTSASAQLRQELQTLIGEPRCDSDAQCKTVGVGQKACGGPTRYLAWSTRTTDRATLEATAARLVAADKTANEKSGRVSNCMAVVDPGAVCRANRCQLADPLAGPAVR